MQLNVSPIAGDEAIIYRTGDAVAYVVGVPLLSIERVADRLANAEPVAWIAILRAFQVSGAAVIDEASGTPRVRFMGLVEVHIYNGASASSQSGEPDGRLYLGTDELRTMSLSSDEAVRVSRRPEALGVGNFEGGSLAVDSIYMSVGVARPPKTPAASSSASGPLSENVSAAHPAAGQVPRFPETPAEAVTAPAAPIPVPAFDLPPATPSNDVASSAPSTETEPAKETSAQPSPGQPAAPSDGSTDGTQPPAETPTPVDDIGAVAEPTNIPSASGPDPVTAPASTGQEPLTADVPTVEIGASGATEPSVDVSPPDESGADVAKARQRPSVERLALPKTDPAPGSVDPVPASVDAGPVNVVEPPGITSVGRDVVIEPVAEPPADGRTRDLDADSDSATSDAIDGGSREHTDSGEATGPAVSASSADSDDDSPAERAHGADIAAETSDVSASAAAESAGDSHPRIPVFDAPVASSASFRKIPLISEPVPSKDEEDLADAAPGDDQTVAEEGAAETDKPDRPVDVPTKVTRQPTPPEQCPNGHNNPPHASLCMVCGERLTPTERPPDRVGVRALLTFDDGEEFEVNNDLLVGRAPGSPVVGHVAEFPNDPMMSREHFRIEVDDQQIVVRDLNSSNGTMVKFSPDGGYERLRAGSAYPLKDGAVIVAGQRWATFALLEN